MRTEFVVVCPITNTGNKFSLHIPLDNEANSSAIINKWYTQFREINYYC